MPELPALPDVLEIRTNADWRDMVQIVQNDDEETPLNLSSATLLMHVRRRREDRTVWMTLSSANGRLVKTDPAEGEIAFNVDAAEIRAKLPPGDYVLDLHVLIDDLDLVPFERGLKVIEGVTR